MLRRFAWLVASAIASAGCSGGAASPGAPAPTASVVAEPAPPPSGSAVAAADVAGCAAPSCRTFATPAEAFEVALAKKPLVVGIGEAHTQKDAASGPTTAKRFTLELLPHLKGRASDLLLEILMPPTGCQKETKQVRSAHAPVTQQQAETNQNDYVTMGDTARKLGVVPDLLRPTCGDLADVADAGADAVPKTLETIARLSVSQVKGLLGRKDRAAEAMIVLYGGALHNDKDPPAERASWSYGKEMSALVAGRYVEVDVFGADQIKDDATWKKLAWTASYDRAKLGDKTTLLQLRDDAFVLVLPAAAR